MTCWCQLSPSTVWVPGVKLRSSVLAKIASPSGAISVAPVAPCGPSLGTQRGLGFQATIPTTQAMLLFCSCLLSTWMGRYSYRALYREHKLTLLASDTHLSPFVVSVGSWHHLSLVL